MMTITHLRPMAAAAIVLGLLAARVTASSDVHHAPAVQLRLADGTTVQPATYTGKVLLVDFWASWCVPCKTAFPALDALYRQYRDQGLQVVAVNLDERQKDADTFLAAHPHVMPIAFDPKGESAQAFALRGMPSSVLIDRSGNIRFTHMGYSTNVLDRYRDEIRLLLAER
jgi:cytochrome c biogenesis protein CcmG/thiol:disulfide interchange protein DsbE